jgi:hypothetical protein
MLVLNLLSLGSLETHTSQLHPINGTPVLVPDPKMVIFSNFEALAAVWYNEPTIVVGQIQLCF